MKRRIAEETVLFISILKWFILATLIGAIVGFCDDDLFEALELELGF